MFFEIASRGLVVVALGTAAVAAGCGSKGSSAPAVQPGKPAGDVRELAGTVTAHRGSEAPRALKAGDEVSGDDVIATGADGSVVIELRHNGVRWSLGANQEKQVSTSAAWAAPRGGGGSVDDRSAAAGRHAEREAADTAENAVATTETAPAPAAAAAAPQAAVVAQPKAEPPPRVQAAAPPKPAADERMSDKDEEVDRAPPKTATRVTAPDSSGGGGSVSTDDVIGGEVAAKATAAVAITIVSEEGPLDEGSALKSMRAMSAQLTACWQKGIDAGIAPGTLTLTFSVSAAGKVTAFDTGGEVGGAVPSCMSRVVKRMQFAAADTGTQITASLDLSAR